MTERLAVNVEQAAEIVGISKRLVETMIARHEFPHVRLGGRVVVPLGALARWLDERGLASVENENSLAPEPRQAVEGGPGRGRRRLRAV